MLAGKSQASARHSKVGMEQPFVFAGKDPPTDSPLLQRKAP